MRTSLRFYLGAMPLMFTAAILFVLSGPISATAATGDVAAETAGDEDDDEHDGHEHSDAEVHEHDEADHEDEDEREHARDEDERENDEREEAEREELEERMEMAVRELKEVERLMDDAEEDGDEARVRELDREAHELRAMLENLERSWHEGATEEDEEEEEMHRHKMHLDLERAELEASFGRLEMVGRIAQISDSELSAAAFAVMHVERFMELPDAIEFLEEMLEESENPAVRRMIRIRLLELNAAERRHDRVRDQLRRLILGD